MGCTIYDISQTTGYSIATISRVINNQGLVKPQTRDKILKVIDEMGYEPSVMAQGLANNSAHVIGLAMGELLSAYTEATYSLLLMNGVVSVAGPRGYGVLIEGQEALAQSSVRRRHVDGWVFMSVNNRQGLPKQLLQQSLPFVYAGIQQPFDTQGHNIYGGFHLYKQEMLDVLYGRGYRNVLLFEHRFHNRDTILISKLQKSVAEFGQQDPSEQAQCRLIDYDHRRVEEFKKTFLELMQGPNRPDALCLDTSQLYVTIHEMLQELGIRVPDDIGIIVASHSKSAEAQFSPPLTSVYLDAFEMGKRCAELLINQLEKSDAEVDRYVPYQFIERESLRPPLPTTT